MAVGVVSMSACQHRSNAATPTRQSWVGVRLCVFVCLRLVYSMLHEFSRVAVPSNAAFSVLPAPRGTVARCVHHWCVKRHRLPFNGPQQTSLASISRRRHRLQERKKDPRHAHACARTRAGGQSTPGYGQARAHSSTHVHTRQTHTTRSPGTCRPSCPRFHQSCSLSIRTEAPRVYCIGASWWRPPRALATASSDLAPLMQCRSSAQLGGLGRWPQQTALSQVRRAFYAPQPATNSATVKKGQSRLKSVAL